MYKEVKDFITRNKDMKLYEFFDWDNKRIWGTAGDLISDYIDDKWLNECESIEQLKDKMCEYVGDFIDGVIIYHSTATAYIGHNQLVDIPSECDTLYDWANYELNDEVFNNIEKLE